jgi:hypothetical protein
LKGTHPARFGLIWFSSFRGEDLNVIFYQNIRYQFCNYLNAAQSSNIIDTITEFYVRGRHLIIDYCVTPYFIYKKRRSMSAD